MNERDMMRVLTGAQPGERRQQAMGVGLVEGVVRSHDVATDMLTFTLPQFDGGKHVYGPAPWPRPAVELGNHGDGTHDHAATVPPVGARCLVALGVPSPTYEGGGLGNPWILGVWW